MKYDSKNFHCDTLFLITNKKGFEKRLIYIKSANKQKGITRMLQKERNLADKSKSKYVRTALIQIKRFKRENPDSSDWLEFIIWFNNRKAELCHSTWRNYKASIAYYLKSQDEHDLAYKVETLSNDGTLHKSDKTTSIKKNH